MSKIRLGLFQFFLILMAFSSLTIFFATQIIDSFNDFPLANGITLLALFVGVMLVLNQYRTLANDYRWVQECEDGGASTPTVTPKLLTPIAILMHAKSPNLTPQAIANILTAIQTRVDSLISCNKYVIGFLISSGLMMFMWGVSTYINQTSAQMVAELGGHVKGGMVQAKQNAHFSGVFSLHTLVAMFSFVIAGFLALMHWSVASASRSFFSIVEDKLLSLTQESDITPVAKSNPVYSHGLIERAAENMLHIQGVLTKTEEGRLNVIKTVQLLGEKVSLLAEQATTQHSLLAKVTQSQIDLGEAIKNLNMNFHSMQLMSTEEGMKGYVRNLDSTAMRILDEMVESRDKTVHEIKSEIRMITRTLALLANEQ